MKKILLFITLLMVSCGPPGENGKNGLNGTNGKDGTTVTSQEFCPGLGGGIGFKESYIILGTKIYAVYYDGSHTALVWLNNPIKIDSLGNATPTNFPLYFVTTDGRNCHFSITSDGQVVY